MSKNNQRGLIIALCSIGGIVVAAVSAIAALTAYTKHSLSELDLSEWGELE